MNLLGIDIGSSSVKVSVVDAETKSSVGTAQSPDVEMDMISEASGWAEQNPSLWWEHLTTALHKLTAKGINLSNIGGIGISYQMHGLVLVDEAQQVLRPAIIWCDSRAVEIGQQAFNDLGAELCLSRLLNSPGNFTASKLRWVKVNEPDLYRKISKILLPGDYINMMLTGEVNTTVSGLSEAMLWDFSLGEVPTFLMDYYGFDRSLIPEIVPSCGIQGKVTASVAHQLGVPEGTPVCYRAGDQPNNALSLNVLQPGEVAGTGGTSGVVYGVVDQITYDAQQRINTFAHVNHLPDQPSLGVLLCINGAGILHKYMRQLMGPSLSYEDLESQASSVPINSDGLMVIPFGNGSERVLQDQNLKASIMGLEFNRHQAAHFFRAGLEGIAYSFTYGLEVFRSLNMPINVIKVGNDNLFRSEIFARTISGLNQIKIEVLDTTGATGAALACAPSLGITNSLEDALKQVKHVKTYQEIDHIDQYQQGYEAWKHNLNQQLNNI